MSGFDLRPPLRGVIYHGNSIVGGVVLNRPDEPFIEEFNREYGRLGLRVEPHEAATGHVDVELRVTEPSGPLLDRPED